jgi:hypothetical protein
MIAKWILKKNWRNPTKRLYGENKNYFPKPKEEIGEITSDFCKSDKKKKKFPKTSKPVT